MGRRLRQGLAATLLIGATITSSMMLGQDRDHDRAIELDKQGLAQQAQGNLAAAGVSFQQELDILRRLATGDAKSTKLQVEMVSVLTGLGDIQVKQTDLDGARETYQERLVLARRLAVSDPGTAHWQELLALSLSQLGEVHLAQGNRVEARTALQECLDIQRRVAAADPNSAGVHRDLVVNLMRMSEITSDPAYPREALDVALAMKNRGILAPDDAWMIDDLHKLTGR